MSDTNPSSFSYTDLDRMSGEVLPSRLLLSAVGGGSGTEFAYACQYVHYAGTPGVLETGVLAQPEYTTVTCVPAVVHDGS